MKNLRKVLVFVLLLSMVLHMLPGLFAEDGNVLGDIESHWGKSFIERLSNVKIVSGYPDGTFKPNNTMTRAEFVTVLVKSLKYELEETDGMWYQKYLESALSNEVIQSNTINIYNNPDENISRIEAVNLISNLIMKEVGLVNMNVKIPEFTDTKASDIRNLSIIYSYNVMSGYPDNSFKPNNTVTRAEISAIFSNMFFGKRDSISQIIELPLFYTYEEHFTLATKDRISKLKNEIPLEYERADSLEELEQIISDRLLNTDLEEVLQENEFDYTDDIDLFISTYANVEENKVLVDLRQEEEFDDMRIKGSINSTFDELLANHDEDTFMFAYNSYSLSKEEQEGLTDKYKYVMFLEINSEELKDIKDYENFSGARTTHVVDYEDSNVPEYLLKRFDEIGKLYNLTWTDEDFENWYNTSSDNEKSKYINQERSVPIFDFENKTVLLQDRGVISPTNQLKHDDPNKYNDVFAIKDMGYISYEIYKKNVEYLINDGADWGQIHLYFIDDMKKDGMTVMIKDVDFYDHKVSFDMGISGEFLLGHNTEFLYVMSNQYDWDILDAIETLTYDDLIQDYVIDNTKMNMFLLHGIDFGQKIFDNYYDARISYSLNAYDNTAHEAFDTVIGGYTVDHMKESGYMIVFRK